MKKLILLFTIFLILSCKNKAATFKAGNTRHISTKDTIGLSETLCEKLADSLHLFTLPPSYYKEYFYINNDENVRNKEYMRNVIKLCNSKMTPYLIEKIIDTTYTATDYATIPLRVGDIALELIEISDKKLNIPTVIFNEFKDPDLVWLHKIRINKTYTYGNVYVPLFFKEPKFKHVNYKNRKRIYVALKKQYNDLEKNKK